MANIPPPIETLRKLCLAVGIDPDRTPVHRLVIDAECGNVVKVYVQQFLNVGQDQAVAEALAVDPTKEVIPVLKVDVDDDGRVEVVCP